MKQKQDPLDPRQRVVADILTQVDWGEYALLKPGGVDEADWLSSITSDILNALHQE